MEKKVVEVAKKQVPGLDGKKITRKEAIKKTGYIAASAASMMILLGSPQAQACSGTEPHDHSNDGPKGSGHGGHGGHH